MQAVLAPGPGRRLAARQMLPWHPPARNLRRLCRIADVVNDQDVADIAGHLGRDVGVIGIHVEAVHADAAGFLRADQLRFGPVGDVVNFEATLVVGLLLRGFYCRDFGNSYTQLGGEFGVRRLAPESGAQLQAQFRQFIGLAADRRHVALGVDDHDVADDARLVAVRTRIVEKNLRHDARIFRIGHIENGGAEVFLVRDVAYVGIVAGNIDLAGSRQFETREARNVVRQLRVVGN